MDDSTEVRRNRNGDAESRRTIPEFTGGPGNLRIALFTWAGFLIARSYRCHQARREGMTADEVRPGRDMTDDALDVMIGDAVDAITEWDSASPSLPEDPEDIAGFCELLLEKFVERQRTQDASAWGDFLDWLGALDLADLVDRRHAAHAFDGYVRQVADSDRSEGGYVTPDPPVNLMLDLAAPAPGERVYDPCFGYGGLLAGAVRRMQAANGAAAGQRVPLAAVTGVERSQRAYLVGLCRVVLAGATSHRLAYADALEKPVPDDPDAGFDCILAVPPVDSWQAFDDEDDVSPFLRHVMAQLRPGGRAVVALPEWPLFHDDSLPMRKKILSDYHVQRVVALPAGAFEPHTAMPMSIVVFSREEPSESVRFATVSPMAWEAALGDETAISEGIGDRPASAGSVSTGVESWSVPVSELAVREYELIAKQSGNEMLDAEIERIRIADPSLQMKSLAEVAEVFSGQHYESDEDNQVFLMLLRAADVTDVRILSPSYGLPEHLFGGSGKPFLREGDLLVPMEDTIGSVGFVEDERWDDVMAGHDIALVRPHAEIIRPGFLAALLRSPACWFWLSGHAAGSSIRQLSISVLRTLTIPVPPLPVQDAVIEALSGPRADALAVLHRLLAQTADHPVALWMESPSAARLVTLAARPESGGAGDDADRLQALSEIARGIPSVTAMDETEDDGRSYSSWLAVARKAAVALDDVAAIPPGAGRLAVLQFVLARLHESLGVLSGADGTTVERLRSVTESMVKIAEYEVELMQRSGGLDVDVTPTEVDAGSTSEVRLRVTNASPVPLRNVRITAGQNDGTVEASEVPYLADGKEHEIALAVRAQDSAQSVRIAVTWQARRVDATPVRGEKELPVRVRSGGERSELGDLGANPYSTGSEPEVRPKMFFGREGVMAQIKRQLGAADHANAILLEGNRRTGKTSILKMIEKSDVPDGWIPVYCSLQSTAVVSAQEVFRVLAQQTGEALHAAGVEVWPPDTAGPAPGLPFALAFSRALSQAFAGERPFETFQLYVSAAVTAAGPRRLLYLIDEFDELQQNIDAGLISPQVPKNIRHLLQHQPGICAIITGSRRLKKLREDYWSALFGLGYRIGISALPIEDARRLVTEPVAGKLRYLPQACDRLVELCACQPFLIQSLCSRVFDRTAAGEDRIITTDAVERAADEMVHDNEHFQTLWDYAGTERRRLLLMFCDRMAGGADAINLGLLEMNLQDRGVPVRDVKELADDLSELRELELLDFEDTERGGAYRLSVPLMAKWMRQKDFDELVARARQEANKR